LIHYEGTLTIQRGSRIYFLVSAEATEYSHTKEWIGGWAQWLSPVIPAIWKVEIRRIVVQGQPGQKTHKTHLSGGVSQAVREPA
jgi:hypothetical protein